MEVSATPTAVAITSGPTATRSGSTATITWTSNQASQSFVNYGTTTSLGTNAENTTSTTSNSVTLTGLTPTTVYYYAVTSNDGNTSQTSSTETLDGAADAPSGLSATSANEQIALSWTAGDGATSYNVYRGTNSGGESATPIATGITSTIYTDSGLTNGIAYYYTIAGVSAVGASAQSNEADAAPQLPIPTGLSATTGQNDAVSLSWTAVPNVTSYAIYRSTASGGEGSTPIASGPPNNPIYGDHTAVNGTTYYYMVAAVSAHDTSAQSNEASATPKLPAPGCQAYNGNTQVTLKWALVPNATSYSVFRGTESGGEGGTPAASGITSAGYVDTGLTNGSTYYYIIASVSPPQTTDFTEFHTNPSSFTPLAPASPSAAPGDAVVTLSWTAPSGATSYTIYRSMDSGEESFYAPYATGVTAASYTDTSVTNETTYYYRIAAVNSYGQTVTDELSATPVAPPDAPAGLAATPGDAQVSLSWTATSGATSYDVYSGISTGGESSTPIATGITSASYTVTSLTNGTAYFFTVTAVDAGGTSPSSNEASATPVAPAFAPTGLTATAGNAEVILAWTASVGGTSYDVYRGTTTGGEAGTPIASGLTSTSYTNTGLTNGTTYYYTVKAVDAGGASAASNEAYATPVAPPAAPTDLAAAAGDEQIGLTWTASSTATSYNVFRGATSGGESTTPVASGITSESYTDAGLTNGTTYYYTVEAINAGGTSSASNEASATPLPPPPAPGGLTATPGDAQVALHWTSASTATSYDVYRGTTTGGESSTPIACGLTSTAYTDTGVTNGTMYYYTVAAVNGGGTSGPSNEASAAPSQWVPIACNSLVVGQLTTSSPISPDNNEGYSAFYSLSATAPEVVSFDYFEVEGPLTPDLYLLDTSGDILLQALYQDPDFDTAYYVQTSGTYDMDVTTATAGQTGEFGMYVECTPISTDPPSNVVATAGNQVVNLTWTAPEGILGFQIQRSTCIDGPYTTIGTEWDQYTYPYPNFYDDQTVTNGQTYYYEVTSVAAGQQGGPEGTNNIGGTAVATSSPVSATPEAPPTLPTIVNCGGAANVVDGALTTSSPYSLSNLFSGVLTYAADYEFTAVDGEVPEFTVTSPTMSDVTATPYDLDDMSYAFGPLTAGTYMVEVTTGTQLETGTFTLQMNCSGVPRPTPAGLTATAGSQSVTLNWTATSGVTAYDIWRSSISGGPYTEVGSVGDVTTYTDTGLAPVRVYYVVTSFEYGGDSPYSNQATAIPTAPTGTPAYQINAGGPAVSPFVADEFYTGGVEGTSTDDITVASGDSAPMAVYQTYRTGDWNSEWEYVLPGLAPNTPYTLRLHFAETEYDAADTRLFSILVNGAPAVTNLDVFSAAGGADTAYVVDVPAVATDDGTIVVSAVPILDYPIISALEVLSGVSAPDVASLTLSPASVDIPHTSTAVVTLTGPAPAGGVTVSLASDNAAATLYHSTVVVPEGATSASFVVATTGTESATANISATVTSTVTAALDIGAPSSTVPSNVRISAADGRVYLFWDAVSGAQTYNIYRGTTSGAETELTTGVTTPSTIDTTVTNGVTYYYTVTAVASGVESSPSAEVSDEPNKAVTCP